MAKLDVLYTIDSPRRSKSDGVVVGGGGGWSGGGIGDLSLYLRRDGSFPMMGNLDLGGFSITSVYQVDGVDVSSFKSLFDIHAANPNAHHPQVHDIVSSNHSLAGGKWSVVGATADNTIGLLASSFAPGAAEALLRTDTNGQVTPYVLGVASGLIRSDSVFSFTNATGGAYQNLVAQDVSATGSLGIGSGGVYSNNYIALRTTGGAAQLIWTGGLMASNDYGHYVNIPANGIYSLGVIRGDNKLTVPTIDTLAGNLLIQPAGDITLNPLGKDVLPLISYDVNLGAINRKFLTLWAAELWVETLVAQETVATIGGRVLVGPTTPLTRDLTPTDAYIYTKHNQMTVGDVVYMEGGGAVEFMRVDVGYTTISTSPPEYRYVVTRNLDGTGGNQWYAGDAVFNTGKVGNGFIDLYSLSGIPRAGQTSGQRAGPTIVGNVRLSTTFNDWRERWAIGKLNGLYYYGNEEFGAAFGNPSASWIGMDDSNGFRVMAGTVNRAQLDVNGNFALRNTAGNSVIILDQFGDSYFAGVMTIGVNGEIRQGTGRLEDSNYTGLRIWRDTNTGRGLIAGYNNNAAQWYAGTDGTLRAGNGAVVLSSDGESISRTTYATTAPIPEPGFGSLPDLSPVPAQVLSFCDTEETFYRAGAPYQYEYPGNELLKIYISSQHHVPTGDPNFWSHYLDGVIEMPNITGAGDNNFYVRRLWLKAPDIILESDVRVAGTLQIQSSILRTNSTLSVTNIYGSAYQNIVAQDISAAGNIGIVGGGIYSDTALRLLTTGALAQKFYAGGLMTSNDYNQWGRIPAHGIYSLGAVTIGDVLTAGYMLDVNGAARIRSNGLINGGWYFSAVATPGASAGAASLSFDGSNFRVRMPDGSTRTLVMTNP